MNLTSTAKFNWLQDLKRHFRLKAARAAAPGCYIVKWPGSPEEFGSANPDAYGRALKDKLLKFPLDELELRELESSIPMR
eukprot:8276068-Alexandrium_andersonii.AAC.1